MLSRGGPADPLVLDLYELTMAQSYFDHGMHGPATFSLFARHLPRDWGYFVAAGLDDVLAYLEGLAFGEDDLGYLAQTGLFTTPFLEYLRGVHFTGTVRALPEGTVSFPNEPWPAGSEAIDRQGNVAGSKASLHGSPALSLGPQLAGQCTEPADIVLTSDLTQFHLPTRSLLWRLGGVNGR